MLGVMTDNPGSGELLNFRSDYDMSYPVIRSDLPIYEAFHEPSALPTTFIFNKRGKQVYSHVGPLDEGDLAIRVEKFLTETP
jgi:hypothetical protein